MVGRLGTLLAALSIAVLVPIAPAGASAQPVSSSSASAPDAARTFLRHELARHMGIATFTNATNADPTGDVDDPRADITNIAASYTAHALVVSVRLRQPTDPRSDDLWQGLNEQAELEFAIGDRETDDIREGGGIPAYIASLRGGPNGTIVAAIEPYYEQPAECPDVRGDYANGRYSITIPARCIFNPLEVRVAAGMFIYDRPFFPFPGESEPVIDIAPDHGALAVQGVPGGYLLASVDGGAFQFGAAPYRGSLGRVQLAAPITDIDGTARAKGYVMLGEDGGVFRFGNAPFAGSAVGGNEHWVAIALTPSGRGYWVASAEGSILAFGDAQRFVIPAIGRGADPIVDIAATPSGRGVWAVTARGGVIAYGDATLHGSTFALDLHAPIGAIAPTPSGLGYWLFGEDGGVFNFGDARFFGSAGALHLAGPIVDAHPTASGRGYTLLGRDGGIFIFRDARWFGSGREIFLRRPMTGFIQR
jgi:hypothetical protein